MSMINEEWSVQKTSARGTVQHLRTPKFSVRISVAGGDGMNVESVKWLDTEPANAAQWIIDAMQEFKKSPISN